MALQSQYKEIFVQRGYDFITKREDPLILDCGGHIGLSAVRFKQQYPWSRVIVFEADPKVAQVLSGNLQALDLKDVRFVQAAVWNKGGTVRFESNRADASRVTNDGTCQVEAVRLADVINEPVDLLKVDIEGAEYPVLLDLCDSGKIRHVNQLVIELHGRGHDQTHVPGLFEALRSHGFRFTFSHARVAPDLPGQAEPTPFPGLADAKFLLRLYAWQSAS
jgi:FkbM family methyltransferase